jgi:hypothetical protein
MQANRSVATQRVDRAASDIASGQRFDRGFGSIRKAVQSGGASVASDATRADAPFHGKLADIAETVRRNVNSRVSAATRDMPTAPAAAPAPQQAGFGKRKPTPVDAPRYASGTPNVPAPGQTQTNGSWGTSAPPPQPLPPSPLGGQNQNLRALLGMGKPRFAMGTADAGAENGLTRAMNAHADQCHPVRR